MSAPDGQIGSNMMDLGNTDFVDLTEIGRGGFGVVFTAHQPAFDRTVAVKVLTLADANTLRRFDRERQALGKVSNHPHITPVFASGFTVSGMPYLAMEFMRGGSLADRLAEHGPLAWQEVLDLGVKLSGALETAHRAGILHRDLKPANVLLSDFGQPRLADFGIASIDDAEQTKTGVITASAAYAAPEVLDGVRPGVPADIYGLGATLFTLVHGRPAFTVDGEESVFAMLLRVSRDPVPDLRPSGVPDAFATVLETAMAKDVAARYQSAEDLGNALREAQRQLGMRQTPMVLPSVKGAVSANMDTFSTAPGETTGAAPISAPAASRDGWMPPTPPPVVSPSPPQAPASPFAAAPAPTGPVQTGPGAPGPMAPPTGLPPWSSDSGPSESGRRALPLLLGGLLTIALVAGGIFALTRGDDPADPVVAGPGATEAVAEAPSADAGAPEAAADVEDAEDAEDAALPMGGWQSARAIPTARQQVPAATSRGIVWVAGGLIDGGVTASTEGFELATNSWRSGPDLPLPLHHHMTATLDGDVVVLGGWSPDGALLSAITSDQVFMLRGDEWVSLPPLLQPRAAGAAATVGDLIVVSGGQDTAGQLITTTEIFDGTGWREGAPMPTPREHLAGAGDDTWFYAVGGRVLTVDASLPTMERYNPVTDVWEQLTDMPTARGGLAAAAAAGLVFAMGGEKSNGVYEEVEVFHTEKGTWTGFTPMPTGRHGLGASIVSGAVVTIGGALQASHEAASDAVEVLSAS